MRTGPFAGLLVVDLTRVLAGPFCTMMLAELGARVLKVEHPGKGDDSRGFDPFVDGKSAYFASLNRNKESVVLDLKQSADRDLLLAMVRRGDVLVENFRPGTMEQLGLGYEHLREVNARLIYAAVSGFGHTGPWSHRPAYDIIIQAMSGMMSVTGEPNGQPMKAGTSIADITGGLFALAGIASALYYREKTGVGMKVDVSMLDGQIAILERPVARCATTGETPERLGNRHPSITPFEPYETADRPLIIAAGNDTLFARLCQAIGRQELASDPRFVTNPVRNRNADELKAALEAVLRTRPAADWLGILEEAGIPCTRIHTVADAVQHPQVSARNMLVSADGIRMAGNPIKLSAFADPPTRTPAPELDAHGRRIRQEFSEENW